jgi:hypothetical protein
VTSLSLQRRGSCDLVVDRGGFWWIKADSGKSRRAPRAPTADQGGLRQIEADAAAGGPIWRCVAGSQCCARSGKDAGIGKGSPGPWMGSGARQRVFLFFFFFSN